VRSYFATAPSTQSAAQPSTQLASQMFACMNIMSVSLRRARPAYRTPLNSHYFGAYCISPLPKDQSSRAESTKLIQISSFRTFSFSCISSAILL
jgi:hypothetical protein